MPFIQNPVNSPNGLQYDIVSVLKGRLLFVDRNTKGRRGNGSCGNEVTWNTSPWHRTYCRLFVSSESFGSVTLRRVQRVHSRRSAWYPWHGTPDPPPDTTEDRKENRYSWVWDWRLAQHRPRPVTLTTLTLPVHPLSYERKVKKMFLSILFVCLFLSGKTFVLLDNLMVPDTTSYLWQKRLWPYR